MNKLLVASLTTLFVVSAPIARAHEGHEHAVTLRQTVIDVTAPAVIATSPANAKTCVALDAKVTAVFSELMDPKTIGTVSMTVTGPGGIAVVGQVSERDLYDLTKDLSLGSGGDEVLRLQRFLFDAGYLKATPNGNFGLQTRDAVKAWQKKAGIPVTGSFGTDARARAGLTLFEPVAPFAPNTKYIAAVTRAATDLAGNALVKDTGWSFVTGPDCQGPAVRLAALPPEANPYVTVPQAIREAVSSLVPGSVEDVDVKFNLTRPGGARCTSVLDAITASFAHHIDSKSMTPENIFILGPDERPIAGELSYLHLHNMKGGLALGSAGTDVMKLQVFLIDLGFLNLKAPTGRFGVDTQSALKAWQKSIGIPATGIFDNRTILNGHVAVFKPKVKLEQDSVYSIVVTTGTKDVFGKYLPRQYKKYFVTGPDCQAGAVGVKGGQGSQGPQGPQGSQGEKGDQGPPGPQGPQGATGTQGERGPSGGAGAAGTGSNVSTHIPAAVAGLSTTVYVLTTTPVLVGVFPLVLHEAASRILFSGTVRIAKNAGADTFTAHLGTDCSSPSLGTLLGIPQTENGGPYRADLIVSPATAGLVYLSVCAKSDRAEYGDTITEITGFALEVGPP